MKSKINKLILKHEENIKIEAIKLEDKFLSKLGF